MELINLHDAIYCLQYQNRFKNFRNNVNPFTAFTPEQSPLLHQYAASGGMNQVPTWLDFVKILGGNPTSTNAKSCLRVREGSSGPTKDSWGNTFGTPRGRNGKPIAADKPLDTMFFRLFNNPDFPMVVDYLYATTAADFKSDTTNTSDISPDCFYYSAGGYSGYNRTTGTLQPGAYLSVNLANSTRSGYYTASYYQVFGFKGDSLSAATASYAYTSANRWDTNNCIFFVDSPVQVTRGISNGYASANLHAFGFIWKLTKEDYWTENI